jgi:Zn-dependent peptidase ImmA (M78 family)
MIRKKIEELTSQILEELNIIMYPIPIKKVAEQKGLKIRPYDLGDDISGALIIDNGQGTIGVNSKEPHVRQRFTIAHELGHFFLHSKTNESLHVDKEIQLLFRDGLSSSGDIKIEKEANSFAASILMPFAILDKAIKELPSNLNDEEAIKKLAQMFEVSTIAMTHRISNLFD